jgi:hypothetical protein
MHDAGNTSHETYAEREKKRNARRERERVREKEREREGEGEREKTTAPQKGPKSSHNAQKRAK